MVQGEDQILKLPKAGIDLVVKPIKAGVDLAFQVKEPRCA